MNNGDWVLLAVVAAAFATGYAIVSAVVKRFVPQKRATDSFGEKSQRKETDSERPPDETGRSKATEGDRHQDQYREWQEDQARRRNQTWESLTEEQKHAKALGLTGKVTPGDIKRNYRELLAKYHPDKVNHLGDEFQGIAEEKTREIIAAYAYFCEKYDLK